MTVGVILNHIVQKLSHSRQTYMRRKSKERARGLLGYSASEASIHGFTRKSCQGGVATRNRSGRPKLGDVSVAWPDQDKHPDMTPASMEMGAA